MKHVVLKSNEMYIKTEYKKEEELKSIFSKHYQQIVYCPPSDYGTAKKYILEKHKRY